MRRVDPSSFFAPSAVRPWPPTILVGEFERRVSVIVDSWLVGCFGQGVLLLTMNDRLAATVRRVVAARRP